MTPGAMVAEIYNSFVEGFDYRRLEGRQGAAGGIEHTVGVFKHLQRPPFPLQEGKENRLSPSKMPLKHREQIAIELSPTCAVSDRACPSAKSDRHARDLSQS